LLFATDVGQRFCVGSTGATFAAGLAVVFFCAGTLTVPFFAAALPAGRRLTLARCPGALSWSLTVTAAAAVCAVCSLTLTTPPLMVPG
jgi:hypothetical protein